MMHVRNRQLAIVLAFGLTMAACSSDDAGSSGELVREDGGGEDGSSALTLVASGTLFDITEFTTAAGNLEVLFDNQDGGVTHNLHIRGNGIDAMTAIEAGPNTQTLSVNLAAGIYDFVCDVHPTTMLGTITAE